METSASDAAAWFASVGTSPDQITATMLEGMVDSLQLHLTDKILSDTVWPTPDGGVELTPLELAVVDTPEFQRLRWIVQLGPSHLVFPTATHTRFQHSIGTLQAATLILRSCRRNAQRWTRKRGPSELLNPSGYCRVVTRLAALCHDLAHVPFAHTLEKEGHLFETEWDSPEILEMLLPNFPMEHDKLASWRKALLPRVLTSYLRQAVQQVTEGVSEGDLEERTDALAASVTSHLRFILKDWKVLKDDRHGAPDKPKACARPAPNEFPWLLFSADVVGNTLCADLVDYVRRDNANTGLEDRVNLRFMRYFVCRSVETCTHRAASHSNEEVPRLVLSLFKPDKPQSFRRDSLSEAVDLLRKRYSLAEKAYFHHAKKSAASMICRAVGASGLRPIDLFWEGDHSLLLRLRDGRNLRAPDTEATNRARRLAAAVIERRLFKTVKVSDPLPDEREGEQPRLLELHRLLSTGPDAYRAQERLEQTVSETAGLESGNVLVYAPDREMNLKVFEALVWPSKEEGVTFLEQVKRTRGQVEAIRKDHLRLWQISFLVDPSLTPDQRERVVEVATAILDGDESGIRRMIIENNATRIKSDLGLSTDLTVPQVQLLSEALEQRLSAAARSGEAAYLGLSLVLECAREKLSRSKK